MCAQAYIMQVARSRTTSGWRVHASPSVQKHSETPPAKQQQVAPTFKVKKIMSWLTAEQRRLAQLLSCRLHSLTDNEQRFCVGIGLVDVNASDPCWPSDGAAQLILSAARRHLWPDVPKSLQVHTLDSYPRLAHPRPVRASLARGP